MPTPTKVGRKPSAPRAPRKAMPAGDKVRRTQAKSTPKPHTPYKYPLRGR
jgi:hypothetical protein